MRKSFTRLGIALAAAFGPAAFVASASAGEARSCFTLEHQTYCSAWSARNTVPAKTEYVRPNETVEHWQRMVTVLRYDRLSRLADVIPAYLQSVRPYLGPDAKPQFVSPVHPTHGEEAATRLLLSTPDGSDSEYVVVYFRTDPGKPSYAIVFSQHVPLPGNATPTMIQYGEWLRDLQSVRL